MYKTKQEYNREPLLVTKPRYNVSNSKKSSSWVGPLVGCFAVASVFGIIILLLILAIPITLLVIGLHYRDPRYCPIQPRISLFLIVHGGVGIGCLVVNILLSTITLLLAGRDSSRIIKIISSILSFLHIIFVWIWLIIGSVWTFGVKKYVTHEYDVINHFYTYNYCHPVLYTFTFIYLIIVYVLLAIGCFCRILLLCCCSKGSE